MDVEIADRVIVDEQTATVRYIGTVEKYGEQIWAGLEWDDPTRGKHDGTVNGKRYFQTSTPKGGSLVKIQNVKGPLDLITEVRHRYDEFEAMEEAGQVSSKTIELVGMEKTAAKQSDIHKLRNIVIQCSRVGRPPPTGTMPFANCVELNLYGNLLHKWSHVKQILKFFPKLAELSLRRNRMDSFVVESTSDESILDVFSTTCIKLNIGECQIDEESLPLILNCFPSVNQLFAFGNGLTKCDLGKSTTRMKEIDIANNHLGSMKNIVGVYSSLRSLNLIGCGITSLVTVNGSEQFPALETLNLKENDIEEWASLNALRTIPNLKNLRLDTTRLPVKDGIAVHEVIIAKLTTIQILNSFDVSEVERRAAEIRFLTKYVELKDARGRADHEEDTKRLIGIHGPPTTALPTQKGLNVVKMSILYEEKVVERSLPLFMNIQRMKDMLSKLFNIDGKVSLYLEAADGDKRNRIELDNDIRPFSYFCPRNDDKLVVKIS